MMGPRGSIFPQRTSKPKPEGELVHECIEQIYSAQGLNICRKCGNVKEKSEPCETCVKDASDMRRSLVQAEKLPMSTTPFARNRLPAIIESPSWRPAIQRPTNDRCLMCGLPKRRNEPCRSCPIREMNLRNRDKRAWCDIELRRRARFIKELQLKRGRAYLDLLYKLAMEGRNLKDSDVLDAQLILDGEIESLRNFIGLSLDHIFKTLQTESHKNTKMELYEYFECKVPVDLETMFLTAPFQQIWGLARMVEALEKMEEARECKRSICVV
jgi:hypothetical protein